MHQSLEHTVTGLKRLLRCLALEFMLAYSWRASTTNPSLLSLIIVHTLHGLLICILLGPWQSTKVGWTIESARLPWHLSSLVVQRAHSYILRHQIVHVVHGLELHCFLAIISTRCGWSTESAVLLGT